MECDTCGEEATFNLVIQSRTSKAGRSTTAYPLCNDCREFVERTLARRHRTMRAANAGERRDAEVQEINENLRGGLESKHDARKRTEEDGNK